jgi:hypothetical protein
MTMEKMETMGDALDELREAFGKDYDMEGPELNCPMCGTYGYCECESSDLDKF